MSEPRSLDSPQLADAGAVVDQVIASRRTSLLMDAERSVPLALIDRLITAATWAPNHKRTWPWAFTVLTGDARGRLGETMAELALAGGLDGPKITKLPGKYCRSASVMLIWHIRNDHDAVRCREDRDAVAAATQNLLVAATAYGLGSYWGTVADVLVPAVREVAGVDEAHDLVALVYLGWPTGTVAAPERPAASVTFLGNVGELQDS